MKNNPITQNKFFLISLFVTISIFFWYVRLNNFNNMMTFHIDQAEHIFNAKEMVDEGKIRLIGPIVSTRVVEGRGYFIGPYYLYILAALGIIFSWNVIVMTKALLLMWWLTSLGFLVWIGKKMNWYVGLLSYLVLAAHPLLIGFSRMFINPNFTAPVGLLFFYFLYRAWKNNKWWEWLLAGVFAGIGISFHFAVMIWLVFIGGTWLASLIRGKAKWWYLIVAGAGAILGDLPYILFELRHNFYNLRTMLSIGVNPGNDSIPAGYYLFAFIPLLIWPFAYLANYITKKTHFLITLALVFVYLFYVQAQNPHPAVRGIGMPKGWSVPLQQDLAQRICDDPDKGSFELAGLITADLRALDLRWWVEQCGAKPAGFMEYPFVDTLFMVDQGFQAKGEMHGNWEVASMNPHTVELQEQLNEYLWFYKLKRVKEGDVTAE